MINVLPLDDSDEHIESPECACKPLTTIINGKLLVVHHAWDFREVFEYLDRIEDGDGASQE